MLEKITNEDERRKYDHQQTPAQRMFIESVDRFLALKREGSPLSFVNLACIVGKEEARSMILGSRFGGAFAGDNEQLAMPSDGSYYPKLDVTKAKAEFAGVSVRAWGWDDDKVRFSYDEKGDMAGYIVYEGEKDHTRRLDISFHYRQDEEYIVETVSLHGGTSDQSNPCLNSEIWMSAYAETGYEGHGGQSFDNVCDDEFEEFIAIAERLTGAISD